MKLGTKIILGFIATCAVFVVISAYIIFALNGVNEEVAELEKSIMPTFNNTVNAQYTVAVEAIYVMDYSYSSNDGSWTRATDTRQYMKNLMEQLKANSNDPVIRQNQKAVGVFQELENNYNKFTAINDRLPKINQDLSRSVATVNDAYEEFIQRTIALRERQSQNLLEELRTDAGDEAIRQRNQRVNDIAQLENHAGQYLINTLKGTANRDLKFFDLSMDEVNACRNLINDLIQGAKRTETEDRQALEELKTMADACEKAIQTLKAVGAENLLTSTERAKLREDTLKNAGDLGNIMNDMAIGTTSDVYKSSERVLMTLIIGVLLALAISIALGIIITKGITGPVNRLIEMLSAGANEVDNASNQLTSASNTLAEGATENAASLEETSAALEELSSMTKRNADNAMEANALMAQAQSAVEKADKSMGSVIQAMDEISVSGNEIGKIIKTIDEIAFQTNLLALNAAVEAARAGEAGAGFAVVADEVRNLAIRSADAAKNTADLIASTIANISSGSEMVNATAENFKMVESHSSKVAELLAEVSEASNEQSQGIGQINTAMTEMDKVTQSNAASAEESASAAGQLSLQAVTLLEAVDELEALVHGVSRGTVSHGASAKPAVSYHKKPAAPNKVDSPVKPARALPQTQKRHDDFDMDDGFDF